VEILESVQRVLRWCDVDAVDPIMSSDLALRLARLYESAALLKTSNSDSSGIPRDQKRLKVVWVS